MTRSLNSFYKIAICVLKYTTTDLEGLVEFCLFGDDLQQLHASNHGVHARHTLEDLHDVDELVLRHILEHLGGIMANLAGIMANLVGIMANLHFRLSTVFKMLTMILHTILLLIINKGSNKSLMNIFSRRKCKNCQLHLLPYIRLHACYSCSNTNLLALLDHQVLCILVECVFRHLLHVNKQELDGLLPHPVILPVHLGEDALDRPWIIIPMLFIITGSNLSKVTSLQFSWRSYSLLFITSLVRKTQPGSIFTV